MRAGSCQVHTGELVEQLLLLLAGVEGGFLVLDAAVVDLVVDDDGAVVARRLQQRDGVFAVGAPLAGHRHGLALPSGHVELPGGRQRVVDDVRAGHFEDVAEEVFDDVDGDPGLSGADVDLVGGEVDGHDGIEGVDVDAVAVVAVRRLRRRRFVSCARHRTGRRWPG